MSCAHWVLGPLGLALPLARATDLNASSSLTFVISFLPLALASFPDNRGDPRCVRGHRCCRGTHRSADGWLYVGYLFKKTRDGKWQKRWFETNGGFLTYYKVRSISRMYAHGWGDEGPTLSPLHVAETRPEAACRIEPAAGWRHHAAGRGLFRYVILGYAYHGAVLMASVSFLFIDGPGLFTIELNERVYTIKARSHDEASFWVDVRCCFTLCLTLPAAVTHRYCCAYVYRRSYGVRLAAPSLDDRLVCRSKSSMAKSAVDLTLNPLNCSSRREQGECHHL